MPLAIVHSLLRHAKNAGTHGMGQFPGQGLCRDPNIQSAAIPDLPRLPFERREQPEVVQHGGPERQCNPPHTRDGLFQARA